MSGRLPIFIISFNRGAFVRQVIDSYRLQSMPIDIIVHDNGSDDAFTLGHLAELEAQGIKVHRECEIGSASELNLLDRTVDAYFGPNRQRSRYVVTDCDIDLSPARADAMEVCSEFLDRCPSIECVGPILRIADVPRDYPLFNRVMNRHIEQFWHMQPERTMTRAGECAFIKSAIDTTFAMHREGSRFRRLKSALRRYHPFEARHLDWYPHDGQFAYHKSSSAAISHWNNASQFAEFAKETLRFDRYNIVETADDGSLVVRYRKILE